MFTLWYSVLSWKEYRDAIWEKLSSPKAPNTSTDSSLKTQEPRIPVIEPPKQPSPQPPKLPVVPPRTKPDPIPQISKPQPPSPVPAAQPSSPLPQRPLEPPAKPPRSPSPHPIRSEAFEDIEYEEEDSDVEEDDENSVIDSSLPSRGPVGNSVNDFIKQEKNTQQNSVGLNQR